MKKIRLYGCPKEMVETYKMLSSTTKVEVSPITDNDLDRTMNEIFMHDCQFEENVILEEMFMIFQGFTPDEMLNYLNILKEHNVPYGGIKIIETDHNKNWKLRDLFSEVLLEHELFKKSEILKQVLISTSNVNTDKLNEDDKTKFKELLMKGYMMLQNPSRDLENIDSCTREIMNYLKKM